MNGFSVAEASQLLGVSEPRIYRALASGPRAATRPRGRPTRVPPEVVAGLLRRWGWVPRELRETDLSREEVFVLAALSRSPLGLRSARSVARRAAIAPATAAKALSALCGRGLVQERQVRVVEGEVADIKVWALNWRARPWRVVAPLVAGVLLPAPTCSAPRQRSVPSRFAHLFWNEDTAHLDVERDGTMIAERILRSNDTEAIAWAGGAIPPASLRRVRGLRNIPPRVAALADALAGDR